MLIKSSSGKAPLHSKSNVRTAGQSNAALDHVHTGLGIFLVGRARRQKYRM
jgi:hypothetical protein